MARHDVSAADAALRALARALLPYLRDELVSAPAPRVYSQLDAERPPGIGRARYLRAWRRGRDAGDAECCADGRARVMTAGAWARHGASSTSPRRALDEPSRPLAIVRDLDADTLAELGLDETRRAG